MNNATIAVSVVLIFFLAIFAGVIILQIFLSKKESKWAGLVLPFISLGISLMAVLGVLLFSVSTVTEMPAVIENMEIINGENRFSPPNDTETTDYEYRMTTRTINSPLQIIVSAVYMFIMFNIPTGVLLAIYAACRGKRKKQRDLEKMSVQDLG